MLQIKCATKDEINNIVNMASNLRNNEETGYLTLVEFDKENSALYGCISINIRFVPNRNSTRPFEIYVDSEGFFEKEKGTLPFLDFNTAKDAPELYAVISHITQASFVFIQNALS